MLMLILYFVRVTDNSTNIADTAGGSSNSVRPADLDAVDRKILSLLHADARMTNNALAEAVGIAPSTCHGRVRRLVDPGVIRGFYTDIDPVAVGMPLQAMISVNLHSNARGKIRSFIHQIRVRRQVMDFYIPRRRRRFPAACRGARHRRPAILRGGELQRRRRRGRHPNLVDLRASPGCRGLFNRVFAAVMIHGWATSRPCGALNEHQTRPRGGRRRCGHVRNVHCNSVAAQRY